MKIIQIPMKDVEETLMKTVNDNSINKIIYEEMMEVINEYLNRKWYYGKTVYLTTNKG